MSTQRDTTTTRPAATGPKLIAKERISGAMGERLHMPPGGAVSGPESDSAELCHAVGGQSGKVRAVGRPHSQRA